MAGPSAAGGGSDGLTELERQRQARIEENRRRMDQLGLSQAVADLQASQQPAAAAAPRRRAPVERVVLAEAELRRSKRSTQAVNYNEQAFFKAAEEAIRHPKVFHVVKRKGGGGGRAVGIRDRGWNPRQGMAGSRAQERCLEAADECIAALPNPAFAKIMTASMVSGGFWCSAPKGLKEALGVTDKRRFTAYLPAGQAVPEHSVHLNQAEEGWPIVWLPHGKGGDFGFSGGWVAFAVSNRLFPGDVVVCEVLPREAHRDPDTSFSLAFHPFRAFDYETEGGKAVREAAAAAAGPEEEEEEQEAAAVEEEDEEAAAEQAAAEEEEEEEEAAAIQAPAKSEQAGTAAADTEEQQGAAPAAESDALLEPSPAPEGSQGAAAAEGAAEQEGEAAAAPRRAAGAKRQRQAQLAEAGIKRQRRASSGSQGAAAAPEPAKKPARRRSKGGAEASAGGASTSAAARKPRAAAAKKPAAAKKAAVKKPAAKKPASKKPAAKKEAKQAEEPEDYDVEEILGVKGRGANRLYLIKWLGWGPEWNSWEPARHLTQPPHTYQCAPGVQL